MEVNKERIRYILQFSLIKAKMQASCPSPVIENVNKITEIIEVDRHVSNRSITQELKMDHPTVLSHLSKVGFKKKLDVWVPHQIADGSNFYLQIPVSKWKEIDPFLKREVTGDEKCVTYDNIV
ncbi:histone-lysine N-methyltransferase SETMAR [Trichonephila clavipes]|uniref:Histone-lysine N-methyltransferase SETMAR n=1 Tax=Trichonephila clavipes TaxID=2585209 RepID=A0A8X6VZY2_TRICX|nr:histone-lysine N-methyltransferase SETMAR [Trichonephila clavipes]